MYNIPLEKEVSPAVIVVNVMRELTWPPDAGARA
jgi:hypothetical protein